MYTERPRRSFGFRGRRKRSNTKSPAAGVIIGPNSRYRVTVEPVDTDQPMTKLDESKEAEQNTRVDQSNQPNITGPSKQANRGPEFTGVNAVFQRMIVDKDVLDFPANRASYQQATNALKQAGLDFAVTEGGGIYVADKDTAVATKILVPYYRQWSQVMRS
ncbi:MAG: hypothetical protein ABSA79_10485 [Candidatus Bathyarchaeia archaeon]|jgi:xanthine/CO dehydrogenase XdhC/CoxF family maturation factor